MMPGRLRSARNLLRLVRNETENIGVAVSFGKDSLVALDLCCQLFPRVEAFYMYRVRGLEIVNKWSNRVRQRFGVDVQQYPHFDLARCYRHGVLQPHWKRHKNVPAIKMKEIEKQFRCDQDIQWIVYGWRRNDSFSRAIIMRQCGGIDHKTRRVFPLRAWRRADVIEYLETRAIPLPEELGRKDQGGLDFNPGALAFLKQHHPKDYDKWIRDFPFSELQLQKVTTCRIPKTAEK